MSDKLAQMDISHDDEEEVGFDIQKHLEDLKLDDKSYDDLKILKRLEKSEPSPVTELSG
jgi:hypothetical protein